MKTENAQRRWRQIALVSEFLRDARAWTEQHEERVRELGRYCQQSAERVAELRTRMAGRLDAAPELGALFQEIAVRDEELAVSCEELRTQLRNLSQAHVFLARERAKYLDVVENTPEAHVITDLRGLIHDANQAAATLLNIQSRFLPGKLLIAFVARKDTRRFRSELIAAASQPTVPRVFSLEMRPRGKDVTSATLRMSAVRGPIGSDVVALRWVVRFATASDAPAVDEPVLESERRLQGARPVAPRPPDSRSAIS